MTTHRKIRFIDETYDISTLYNETSGSERDLSAEEAHGGIDSLVSSHSRTSPVTTLQGLVMQSAAGNEHNFESSSSKSTVSTGSPSLLPDAASRINGYADVQELSEFGYYAPTNFPSYGGNEISQPSQTIRVSRKPGDKIYALLWRESPALYWCDGHGVKLLRHFVEKMAPIYDYGGCQRTFATIVPQMAAHSPALFEAISAVAALNLEIVGDYQAVGVRQLTADAYRHRSIAESQDAAVEDDQEFLASRLFGMFDDFARGRNSHRNHGLSVPVIDSQQAIQLGHFTLADELRQDMIWASLRVRLYFAVINQEHDSVYLTVNPAESSYDDSTHDYHWARRMILHLHNVVSYCFGAEENSIDFEKLVAYTEEWVELRPLSYEPIFAKNQQKEAIFPDIYLLNDSVALGWQFYHLSRILLVAHDPNRPMLGPGGALARRSIDVSTLHPFSVAS
jgi:hypothetical protein